MPEPCAFVLAEHNGTLICGTYGVELRHPDGAVIGCALRKPGAPFLSVTALRFIDNALWLGTASGVKVMKLPE